MAGKTSHLQRDLDLVISLVIFRIMVSRIKSSEVKTENLGIELY